MITENDALKKLEYLATHQMELAYDALMDAVRWLRYAQEALTRDDIQCAKACIAVAEYHIKGVRR